MLLAQARRSYIGHSSETKPRNTFRGRITGNGSHRQKLGRIAGKWVTPKYLGHIAGKWVTPTQSVLNISV